MKNPRQGRNNLKSQPKNKWLKGKKNIKKGEQIDIIILHSNDTYVTAKIKKYLEESFSFTVDIVENLPTKGNNQYDKVVSYIRDCKLPMVVATFNGESPLVKPNVITEINLCHDLHQNNFLIIREKRKKILADLGSNLVNKFPEIIFEKNDLLSLFIKVNKEIFISKLLSKNVSKMNSDFSSVRREAADLNIFLDRMDRIWEDEFDLAADFIERNDWKTEKEFQNKLDAFFLKYWAVFDAMIRGKKEGKALRKIGDINLNEAYSLAFDVWYIVVKSRLDALDEKVNNAKNSQQKTECTKAEIDELHKTVNKLNNARTRKKSSIEDKIKIIKEINDKISKCLKNN